MLLLHEHLILSNFWWLSLAFIQQRAHNDFLEVESSTHVGRPMFILQSVLNTRIYRIQGLFSSHFGALCSTCSFLMWLYYLTLCHVYIPSFQGFCRLQPVFCIPVQLCFCVASPFFYRPSPNPRHCTAFYSFIWPTRLSQLGFYLRLPR